MMGVVYLVGAGPGDPGLLTLRGAELLGRAEVLVYDYLAAPDILNLVPSQCRRIYVGKKSGHHALPQEEINRLLVAEGLAGHTVVRLKGGDPYIFGRGGEEAQALFEAGLPFEVVPGVSSTVAAAAYAGIPLTHRDFSSQALLMTGSEKPDRDESAHDWGAVAQMGTIVMVMGVKNLSHLCSRLMGAGRPASTPAALVRWGTTCRQRTLVATLGDLSAKAEAANFQPPALLVVGQVVSLRESLNWFERRPLFGRRLLVTRSREQASRLSAALKELGAEVWERPTIKIEPRADLAADPIWGRLADFDWLVFTSPNGVKIFLEALFQSDQVRDSRILAGLKIAALGPGTEEALRPFGLRADLRPDKIFQAEGLLEAMLAAGAAGQKILLARAKEGREVLPQGLGAAGAQVEELVVYQTITPGELEPLAPSFDLTTFTSSSTAQGLAAFVPEGERQNYPAASIGPVTTKTARDLGFPVVIEAASATVESLIEATSAYLSTRPLKDPR